MCAAAADACELPCAKHGPFCFCFSAGLRWALHQHTALVNSSIWGSWRLGSARGGGCADGHMLAQLGFHRTTALWRGMRTSHAPSPLLSPSRLLADAMLGDEELVPAGLEPPATAAATVAGAQAAYHTHTGGALRLLDPTLVVQGWPHWWLPRRGLVPRDEMLHLALVIISHSGGQHNTSCVVSATVVATLGAV